MTDHNLRSRQLNPCDVLFWKSRGYLERPYNWQEILESVGYYDSECDESGDEEEYSEEYEEEECFEEYEEEEEYFEECEEEEFSDEDEEYEEHCLNSNINNPNNDAYWQARGWSARPDDWRERIHGDTY